VQGVQSTDINPTPPMLRQLPEWVVIGFTGHRKLGENYDATVAAVKAAVEKVKEAGVPIAGISSAASGADTIFAEEILGRSAPLMIVLPFDSQRFSKDFEGDPEGLKRSQGIICRAVEVDVVQSVERDLAAACEGNLSEEDRKQSDHVRAADSYWEAGVRTVDRADVLLAVWNEKEGQGAGGTCDAVSYADALGLPIIIFNPETRATTFRRFEKLTRSPESPVNGAVVDSTSPRQIVEEHFNYLDLDASDHAPKVRKLIRKYVYAHLLASSAAAMAIAFEASFKISLIPAVLEVLVLIYAVRTIKNRGERYRKWLPRRVEAEVCRSFLHTWDIRRHATHSHMARPPLPSLADLFKKLRMLRRIDRREIPSMQALRDKYLVERVDHQLNYFRTKREQAVATYKRIRVWSTLCSGGAAIAASCAVVTLSISIGLSLSHHEEGWLPIATHLFEFLGIVLPLGASAAGFLMVTEEASRRVERYKQVQEAIERLKPMVAAAPTWDALARAATLLEEEILQELVEWQSFVRFTEHLH
jgi:hypothetical protein